MVAYGARYDHLEAKLALVVQGPHIPLPRSPCFEYISNSPASIGLGALHPALAYLN